MPRRIATEADPHGPARRDQPIRLLPAAGGVAAKRVAYPY